METKIKLDQEEQKVLDMLTYSETAERNGFTEQREISTYVMNNLLELYYNVFQKLEHRCMGIKINSAYRCERTNEAVGGVRLSQHRLGQAIDITCNNIRTMWELLQEMEVDQCIKYKTFIHVSYVTNRKNRNQYIDKSLTK